MTHKAKVAGATAGMPGALLQGLAVSLAITLIGAAIFAYLISGETLPETSTGYCAMIIVILASALGAMMSVAKSKQRRALTSLLSGACYYIVLLAMTALFFGGQYQGLAVTALLIFGGIGFVILLGLRPPKLTHSHRRKNKYR